MVKRTMTIYVEMFEKRTGCFMMKDDFDEHENFNVVAVRKDF